MDRVYPVGKVNAYIKNMYAQDILLRRLSVSGEVSNCKYHSSGHIYFTLKDEGAAMSCVMFAGSRGGLAFAMKDGDRVVVTGSIEVYERDGRYQLYARKIELEGAGLLYERFLRLKAELEEMGMFAAEYKQPIPAFVRRLGIVTAPTGAAVQDIRNVSLRRNPFVQLILYPAQVQGEGAKESIVRGIETLDALGVDAIIVGRGGGSIEDLWAFNEEEVARAIFACRTPVISAVGHETDVTIADFVADLRAPTPSAAAELAVADVQGILDRMEEYRRRLRADMRYAVDAWRSRTEQMAARWKYLSPASQIREKRQRAVDLEERLRELAGRTLEENRGRAEDLLRRFRRRASEIPVEFRSARQERVRALQTAAEQGMRERRHSLQLYITKMEGLSPLKKLNQGYARAETAEGSGVASVTQVKTGDPLQIYVQDGRIEAEVQRTEKASWL